MGKENVAQGNAEQVQRGGDPGVERCSKDTAVNTSTHVMEEVKCR